MHYTLELFLVIVVTFICANLPSWVEPTKTTMKSLPTARHGSVNNLTRSLMNGYINSSNAINVRNNNLAARNNHNRIVGGHFAKKNQFPFMVSIYKVDNFYCGGTLLKPDWVLTALHCIHDTKHLDEPKIEPYLLTAFAGHIDLSKVRFYDITSDNPEMREVYETYPYGHYRRRSMAGDIGLIRLKSNFKLGKNIQLAPLDPDGITKEYYEEQWIPCTVAGWGRTTEPERHLERKSDLTRSKRSKEPRLLRYLDVTTLSTYRCNRVFDELVDVPIQNKNHICAQAHFEGACSGDSGGPLLCGFYQVGVIAFVIDCSRNPTAFTRIAAYKTWITDTIDLHKDDPRPPLWRSNETSASSTTTRPGACVVGVAIIVMVIGSNVLC